MADKLRFPGYEVGFYGTYREQGARGLRTCKLVNLKPEMACKALRDPSDQASLYVLEAYERT